MPLKESDDDLYTQMLNTMQPVLDSFSKMLGIWLKFVDVSGRYIITAQQTEPCGFCRTIRSIPHGLERCHNYARRAVNQSKEGRGPFKSVCHAGLVTISVPVMVEGRCFGALMAGEIVEDPAKKMEPAILKLTADLPVDRDTLINYFREITVWKAQRLETLAQTLYAISNCFIQLGITFAGKEKTELTKALREAEIRALQAQINPHFLFNTLNTIEMLAMMEGARDTTRIVHSLAQILRHNLNSKTELTTLASELESITHYLLIQQRRFGDRLKVFQSIDPDLLKTRIPALCLQPLVENAVVHGLEPLEGPGTLEITGEVTNGDVVFVIRDNGIGIAQPRLNEIISSITDLNSNTGNIGLVNVQKRCRLLFGSGYGISISSVAGRGTEVTLRLPKAVQSGGDAIENTYC